MSPWNARRVERRLAGREEIETPDGLLEKLKADIPDELVVPLRPVEHELPPSAPRRSWRRHWKLAASFVMLVGAGALLFRVAPRLPRPGEKEQGSRMAAPAEATLADDSKEAAAESVTAPASASVPALIRGVEPAEVPDPQAETDLQEKLRQVAEPKETDNEGTDRRGRVGEDRAREEFRDEISVQGEAPPAIGSSNAGAAVIMEAPPPPEHEARRSKAKRVPALDSVLSPILVQARPRSPSGPLSVSREETRRFRRLTGGSTGGTSEPNDRPYGDVFYKSYGTHPFVDTQDDPQSTFGLDVDTGSYSVARRYLSEGHLPDPDSVRVEEFINALDYGDPPPSPRSDKDFTIHAEGAPSPFAQGPRYQLLRFNLSAREILASERKPAVLTFVVDTSGSMGEGGRLELVKESLNLLLDELSDLEGGDRVGLVTYGSRGEVVLEPTSDRAAVRLALNRLYAQGSTNAEEGLVLGYDLARRHLRRSAVNRVILCSDGVANVGRTGPESILERIGREANDGIELTTLGFGMGNYNDVLMEQLADRGDGRYAYIDTLDEARRLLVEGLTGTLQTVARDAKVQVEFNPEVVARYRLLGYENRDIADDRFRDDTVDAGEIGAGHRVTALYEIKAVTGAPGRADLATFKLRYRSLRHGGMREMARSVRLDDFAESWSLASPALRLTSVVAEFAEILKGSYWAKEGDLDKLLRRAQRVAADDYPGDAEKAELVHLMAKATQLKQGPVHED